MNNLHPETLPLEGSHLIEASAGTGKTYNITRIYLRLLLERKLDVKNILVMTFTRAATEELRGRIAQEIRNALDNWPSLCEEDEFFRVLGQKFSRAQAYPVLHNALLHLDEAAICTIHGFCKRVLSQQAFSSGVAFNVQMEADTQDIELDAVRDWYRILTTEAENYRLLTDNWPSPELFYQAFRETFSNNSTIELNSAETVLENYFQQKKACLQLLLDNQDQVFAGLIDTHKNKLGRTEEWELLIAWLRVADMDPMPEAASGVFHGGRFPKKNPEQKAYYIDLFSSIKQLKIDAEKIKMYVKSAKSYAIAVQGFDVIRGKITASKNRSHVMNYDDLINRLAVCLDDGATSLVHHIQQQYPVALVDEFQDTDPQQYAILKALYLSDNTETIDNETRDEGDIVPPALYMIGDPKQAIYAFRSGDVFTYLSARDDADHRWSMDTNWRSSKNLIDAYNRLFHGAPLNEPEQDVFGFNIRYNLVNPAKKIEKLFLTPSTDSLTGDRSDETANKAALKFIHFPFNEAYALSKKSVNEVKQSFCTVIADWCCSEIHQLLSNNTTIDSVALQEQDIAVLVRDKREAAYIQKALRHAGYASVYLSTHDNVFQSVEAIELEMAINAVLHYENDQILIAGLSTRFFACDAKQLLALQEDEEQWEIYREQLFELRETWLKRGFLAMSLKLIQQNFRPDPLQHERSLTNAIQLLELLQQASQRHRQPEQLIKWFREQLEEQGLGAESELRLESDANLIRLITQHGAKGLEYPVVFVPFSTRYKDPTKFGSKNIDLIKYHDPETQKLRFFVGQDKKIAQLYSEEARAETVRLLYVAITRAEHRCYVCAAPFSNHEQSPLGRTLKLTADNDLFTGLTSLLTSNPESISLQSLDQLEFVTQRTENPGQGLTHAAAKFSGRIERNWWLSSFSALTRNLRQGGVSTPNRDQDESPAINGTEQEPIKEIRFELTKGADTGNLLHDILEHIDFSHPQWSRVMERPIARFNEELNETKTQELIAWLDDCLRAQLPNGPRLEELTWQNTLRETEFYFPMKQVKVQQLGELLTLHRKQQGSTNESSPSHTEQSVRIPGAQILQGMMHGFIDLVFQWQEKFYIVDHKSSHLGDSFDDYNHDALLNNVRKNFYDLQYLLYSLALHRYLTIRIEDYEPRQHFGGVYYLYLRGMQPGSNNGIFHTVIETELLMALDNLFSNKSQATNV